MVSIVPSCSLMLKSEWPLLVPNSEQVKQLSEKTFDISEYIVSLTNEYGKPENLDPLPKGVALHFACHARAQNMGNKAADMLKMIPDAKLSTVERCSGHGERQLAYR